MLCIILVKFSKNFIKNSDQIQPEFGENFWVINSNFINIYYSNLFY